MVENNMTKKTYNILALSIKETKESGVTSGNLIRKVIDEFVKNLNKNLKQEFVNYNEDKFYSKIYGKERNSNL